MKKTSKPKKVDLVAADTNMLLIVLTWLGLAFVSQQNEVFRALLEKLGLYRMPGAEVVLWGLVAGLLSAGFNKVVNDLLNKHGLNKITRPLWNWATLLGIAFVAPLSEEILFRGVVQSYIGFIPTAVGFAFFHIETHTVWNVLFSKLPTGLLFGWLLLHTNNIWACIIAHAINNVLHTMGPYYKSRELVRGIQLFLDGKPKEAILVLDEAIKRQPTPYAFRNRASVLSALGRYEEAIADASRAIEMHDNFPYIIRAEAYLKKGELDLAHADVKQAVKHNPKSFFALRIAGSVFNARLEYAEAASCFEKAYTISKSPLDLINAISSNLLAHRYADCIKACDIALKSGVLQYLVCVNRAFAQLGMNEYENACKDCDAAIKYAKDSELALAYASKAIAHASARRWDECLEYCEKALAVDPIFAPALNVRVYSRIALKQFDDAEAELTFMSSLPKSNSSLADMFYYKALLAISKNNIEEALTFATESKLAWPGSASRISLLALALLHAERYSEAVVEFSKAIELDPLHAEAYWYRSKAQLALGNKELYEADKRIAEKYKYIPIF